MVHPRTPSSLPCRATAFVLTQSGRAINVFTEVRQTPRTTGTLLEHDLLPCAPCPSYTFSAMEAREK